MFDSSCLKEGKFANEKMGEGEVELLFVFRSINGDDEIENHVLYEIRKEVSHILELSEFGETFEVDSDKFANVFAIPIIDSYYQLIRELNITYHLPFPLENGNLIMLIDHIEQLRMRAEENNVVLIFRITFT